jgi:mRNA-degrading endonuclease RelE of RelBE toxin-antitoxin system
MIILRKREYTLALKVILSFIAKDSKNRASNFKSQLDNRINNLDNFPYKFKKSENYQDENVRAMTFKGYTIAYLVEEDKNRVSVLDIYKWIDK